MIEKFLYEFLYEFQHRYEIFFLSCVYHLCSRAPCLFSVEEDTKTSLANETTENEQSKTQSNGDTGESQSYIVMTLSFNRAWKNIHSDSVFFIEHKQIVSKISDNKYSELSLMRSPIPLLFGD